jgi:ATP-binding cassette, subfamily B, heavy metal transporter
VQAEGARSPAPLPRRVSDVPSTALSAPPVTVVFWRLGNVAIAVSTLLTVAAHTGCAYFLTKASVRFNRASNEAADAVGSREVESLSCFETVKSHGRTDAEVATYEGLRETSRAAGANGMAMMTVMHSSLSLIESLGTTAGLVIAAWATAHGTARLSPGDFVLVSMYISNLFNPLTHLVQMYKQFVLTLADLEKAAAVLMRAPDVSDADNAFDLLAAEHALKGDVVFENVSYRYKSSSPAEGTACKGDSDSESDAAGEEEGWMNREPGGVSNVSFRIPAGKTLALCGASGSGKSTIVALLLRLYDCDHGRVLVDGHDVRTVTQRSLRQVCGLVAQETVLFNDTLRYNILYGAPAAPDVQVREALRAAAMGEFLEAQDEGLDVVVGQRGRTFGGVLVLALLWTVAGANARPPSLLSLSVKLSGGECQRVGNARALIKDPTILVLDEATSALDSQTEKTIQGELRERFSGRTTLIIAHRLSTIVHSDEILVLSKGEIKERGTHAQLVGRPDGVYANMWRLQTVTKPPSPSSSDAASTASSREASHKASS